MITRVSFHSESDCRKLMVFTRNNCSSSGEELPAWPSSAFFALRKLTAGRFPGKRSLEKIGKIVLVVSLVGTTNHSDGSWRKMVRIGRLRVILKRFMVRAVVGFHGAIEALGACAANGFSICCGSGSKSALKLSPSNVFCVEQISNVRAGHAKVGGTAAVIVEGVHVADGHAILDDAGKISIGVGAVDASSLTGYEIQRARGGGTESGAEGIIVDGKMLRVSPNGGDGVAGVVAHHCARAEIRPIHEARRGGGRGRKLVHEALIEGLLLGSIVMVHVAGVILRAIEAEGLIGVGVVGQQSGG